MDIWVANADGTDARRVTATAASETAPYWSPTGQEIAFTSDRGGGPQIYVMDSEGLNVRRLTTVGNWNDAPAWNPSKQYSEIAYTSRLEGGFEVAVVDLATRQVRQITQGRGSCEFPTWAPNGRHLAFSCNRGGTWQITISDREGRIVQTLATGTGGGPGCCRAVDDSSDGRGGRDAGDAADLALAGGRSVADPGRRVGAGHGGRACHRATRQARPAWGAPLAGGCAVGTGAGCSTRWQHRMRGWRPRASRTYP